MLKRAYVLAAQRIFAAPLRQAYASPQPGQSIQPGRLARWFASLGAIYHLDRMVALDIPWWNVAAKERIEHFLATRKNARVFEYGSGSSTVWLARRASEVHTVEHDPAWADRLKPRLAAHSNVRLTVAALDRHRPAADQSYVQAIAGTGSYDLIVIDGRLRNACLAAAIPALAPKGLILFDDSGRGRYRSAIEGCGLKEDHFYGLSYCVPYPDHSSILFPG